MVVGDEEGVEMAGGSQFGERERGFLEAALANSQASRSFTFANPQATEGAKERASLHGRERGSSRWGIGVVVGVEGGEMAGGPQIGERERGFLEAVLANSQASRSFTFANPQATGGAKERASLHGRERRSSRWGIGVVVGVEGGEMAGGPQIGDRERGFLEAALANSQASRSFTFANPQVTDGAKERASLHGRERGSSRWVIGVVVGVEEGGEMAGGPQIGERERGFWNVRKWGEGGRG